MSSQKIFLVEGSEERLDIFLSSHLGSVYSRNTIQKLIKEKKVQVYLNDQLVSESKIKPSLKVYSGMKIVLLESPSQVKESYFIEPVPMDLNILYEDDYLAVLHKPAGISVHPGPNEKDKITLLHGILHHWKHLQDQMVHVKDELVSFRPGLVHRLDKMTEGVLVVAKNISTQWKLSKLFLTRNVKKTYIAWLLGAPPEEKGMIDLPLKRHPKNRLKMHVDPTGRKAITEYEILKSLTSNHHRRYTKVQINLITGRTHQIRAHFHHLKCPVVGDDLYYDVDEKIKKYGLLLLSKEIFFIHPETNQPINISIQEPERFKEFERKCIHY